MIIKPFSKYAMGVCVLLLTMVTSVWSSVSAIAAIASSPIGTVERVEGQGWGKTTWGVKYDKLVGDFVVMDEVVGTGKHSNMRLTFIDETSMSLGEDAEIIIDEMVYDPDNTQNDKVILRLGVGAFYFVSGHVSKEKVQIITPTTTIGIRGTELVINVSPDGSTSVGVAKGRAYMNSRGDKGGHQEIEAGNTARSDAKGHISDPFPGIDLTGDRVVDRNILGASDWLDEGDKKSDDKLMDENAENAENAEDDEDHEDDRHAEEEAEDDKEVDMAEAEGADDDDEEEGESENGECDDDGDDSHDGDDGGDDGDGGSDDGDDSDSDGDDDGGHGDDGEGDDDDDDDGRDGKGKS